MKLTLPPPTGLSQDEFNRRVVAALAALTTAVTKIEARLTAAGIP